ncbi:MAG: hypothetical protein EHM23_28620 [Acidobacteria bacterium]|nr:MAG: hypothetical protein EHM23_28620 [Acidobacteriota bacterium]
MQGNIYRVRYKQRMLVTEGHVRASSPEKARELAEKWCNENSARFIFIGPFFLADEFEGVKEEKPVEVPALAAPPAKKR